MGTLSTRFGRQHAADGSVPIAAGTIARDPVCRMAPRGSKGGQWFGPEGPVVVGDEPNPDVPVVERWIFLVEAHAAGRLTPNTDQSGGRAVLGDGQLNLAG